MRTPPIGLLLLLVAAGAGACVVDIPAVTTTTATGGPDTGATDSGEPASASETGAPTTQGDATSTSTSTDEPASTSGGPDTTGDTGSSSADVTSTGVVDNCTLEYQASQIAGQHGEDCGVVDLPDDVGKWQAAHDCALAAAAEQRAFKLITLLQTVDGFEGEAYVAQEARSYAPFKLFLETDPDGGGGWGPVIFYASCTGITATPDCTVEPGNVCLSCDDQGGSSYHCPPI